MSAEAEPVLTAGDGDEQRSLSTAAARNLATTTKSVPQMQGMNQVEQQLRLTVEALRERQEHELVSNAEFGLPHNADLSQRIHTRTGPPTPDAMDELLCRRRKTRFFLAHPRAIAAFGRECGKRGLYPPPADVDGRAVHA